MAKISLDPNEIFEHFHSESSFTILLEGKAAYLIDGIEKELTIDDTIVTPANTSHTLKNIGSATCVLECGHGAKGNN